MCGNDVTKADLRIVEGVEIVESIKNTSIVLIPKVLKPTSLS